MIYKGDLFDVLPTLDAESIDACVTDPPYELGFMGKHWDASGVAFNPDTWRQVFRVLKPGAHLVAFGGTRTFHRLAAGIEDAGFEIRDCLSWLYGSGFPKSLNLPGGLGTALKPSWEPCILARKPTRGTVAANVAAFGTGAINVDACRIDGGARPWREPAVPRSGDGSHIYGSFKKEGSRVVEDTDMGRWPANVLLDEIAAAALDAQTGELVSGDPCGAMMGVDTPRNAYGRFAGGIPLTGYGDRGGASRFFLVVDSRDSTNDNGECDQPRGDISESLTAAGTESGASLATEESINNSNIDGCGNRPADQSRPDTKSTIGTTTKVTTNSTTSNSSRQRGTTTITSGLERTMLSSTALSSGDASGAGSIAHFQSSLYGPQEPIKATVAAASPLASPSGERATESTTTPTCASTRKHGGLTEICSTGQAPSLRFYYVAKPSRAERDQGCHGLTERPRDDGRKDGNPGGDNPRNRGLQPRGNHHPTVKPVELMRWLVRLVTPPDGIVLDPFTGSGTTGMACRYEQRRFIGIEREAEYVEIAERRIASVTPLFSEVPA